MVPSWQWSRRRISAPALQPQSVCAICLYIMQHPDTPVPRDSRVQRSAGATRSTRSAPRRGLGIFNLGLGPALVSLECVRRQSTAARHLVAQHLEGSRPQNANHQSQLKALCFFQRPIFLLPQGRRHRQAAVGPCLRLYTD